jgi:hypothetical protein
MNLRPTLSQTPKPNQNNNHHKVTQKYAQHTYNSLMMISGAQMVLRGREISLISSNMLEFQDKNSSFQTCEELPKGGS